MTPDDVREIVREELTRYFGSEEGTRVDRVLTEEAATGAHKIEHDGDRRVVHLGMPRGVLLGESRGERA